MEDFTKIPSPCYVLEEDKFYNNLKLLSSIQDRANIDIILALKGFAMWSIFPVVKEHLKGAAASSLNEVLLCNEEMGQKAHTYAVAYSSDEFNEIAKASSHLTFNSLNQFVLFESSIPKELKIGLRINPEYSDVENPLYNPADPQSRLGMTIDQMPSELPERIEGLHFHVLCESSAESLIEVLENVEKKFGKYLHNVEWINMGGGHLITREGYNTKLLIKKLIQFQNKYNVKIILEPGGAIAWQTGYLRSKILDIVENGGVKTIIADISFTCHMPDCLEMPYRPDILNADKHSKRGIHNYRIGGVSCLAGDYLESYSFDQEQKVGDTIIFNDMMHYTMVKTTTFNGVKHPSIGTINKNGDFKLVKSFSFSDYKERLS